MAVDPLKEQLISLRDAACLFPTNARGKHPHISAIYRYTTSGCRGVILESAQAGAVRCTSREAVARFIRTLTEQADLPGRQRSSDTNAADKAGQILDETVFKRRRRKGKGTKRTRGQAS